MFKLESYITPILLSYVDKYIKNFRPEDSQVSLWGGEVSFHNLDLRLEVLEEELQLPFSFVSGHIHELLIHVPWTKLASEPITITINTIECILKLKSSHNSSDCASSSSSGASNGNRERRKNTVKKEEIENPPGYIQSVVNKIVGNITINCNNLILKYVEEDIVVSMNIKLLTVESADEEWKPAFTELSANQVIIRKLITLTDLTVCLDRRNAAGKIDVYQEPMLYRCSLELRFLRKYHNATAKQASTTRIDIHCSSMEFSMTSQQFPMLMRLLVLVKTLQSLKKERSATPSDSASGEDSLNEENQEVGWAGWAWSLVPSILPTWDEDWSAEQQAVTVGHTVHIGVYVDNALFSFKVSESSNEKTYYAPRKLKYWPILSLRVQGCMIQSITHNVNWVNCQVGIAKLFVLPSGECVCGTEEVTDNTQPQEYFRSLLNPSICHFSDSLLDSESFENKGLRRAYNLSWDEHITTVTEETLLSRSPALAIDFLYNLELPEDFPTDNLTEITCDLEYSNFKERSLTRIFVGPFNLRYSAGLVHRLAMLQQASELYDYQPYFEAKPTPSLSELPPPSSEDYDSLIEYIPMQKTEVTCVRPLIEFVLWDHFPNNQTKKRHQSFVSVNEPYSANKDLPKLRIEIENISVKLETPMYPNRLVYTTCKLPNPPKALLESCYSKSAVTVHALKLNLVVKENSTTLLNPMQITLTSHKILLKKYWQDKDVCLDESTAGIDVINITSTKARLLIASHILDSILSQNKNGLVAIFDSTLLIDSYMDARMEHLEFVLEHMYGTRSMTICTQSYHFTLESCKAFVIEPMLIKKDKEATYTYESSELGNILLKTMSKSVKIRMTETFNMNQSQQVIILSGPEAEMKGSQMVHNSNVLLSLTVQLPNKIGVPDHPALVLFNLSDMRVSLDPLFCRWLQYKPKKFLTRRDKINMEPGGMRRRRCSEASGASLETPRRVGPQPTSVHSSENQPRSQSIPIRSMSPPPPEIVQEPHETQWYKTLLEWHVVWKSLLVIGDINQITLYFPTAPVPALGAQNLQGAYLNNMNINPDLEIFVMKLPCCSLRSASQRQKLDPYIIYYPIKLPDSIWTDGKKSFPWSISIWDFTSYTVRKTKSHLFIKPVTCNATIAVTTKSYHKIDTMKHDLSKKNSKSDNSTDSHADSQMNSNQNSDHSITPGKVPSLVEMFNKNSNTSLDQNATVSSDQVSSLAVCVYLDTMPIVISMSEPQVALISSILQGVSALSASVPEDIESFRQPSFPRSPNPTTPTEILFKESTRGSTVSGTSQSVEETDSEFNPKFTIFVQWTLTRFSVKLYGNEGTTQLKLLLDVEDIVNSFDMQSVYVKLKSKIATASIRHFRRDTFTKRWINGPYLGIVMKVRENGNSSSEENCFINVVLTRARCGNVHSKWGASKKNKYREKSSKTTATRVRYLSELMVNVQSVDIILSPKTLSSFMLVLSPLTSGPPNNPKVKPCIPNDPAPMDSGNFQSLAVLNLPLMYLDVRGLRIIFPSSDNTTRMMHQDVYIVQIAHINLNPTPDNPICRVPLRPDLYQQAAQAGLLNVPGSEMEDRQYQLTASAFNISTCLWSQLKHCLSAESTEFNLRTMNENPALEWNNMDSKKSALSSNLILVAVMNKFDLCLVAAPAMVHGPTIICGHAVEINCVSDLDVNVSIDQVKLAQSLAAECGRMLNPIDDLKRSSIIYPYDKPTTSLATDDGVLVNEIQFESNVMTTSPLDSGVDVGDFSSENITLSKLNNSINETIDEYTLFTKKLNEKPIRPLYDADTFIPFELLFTGGTISIAFYQNHKTTRSRESFASTSGNVMIMYEKGYEASEDDYQEEGSSNQMVTQPLIRLVIQQPNSLVSKTAFDNRLQISIFDIRLDISVMNASVDKNTPQPNDYRLILFETKQGQLNPGTGIPPALATIRWTSGIGKAEDLDITIARPIKVHFSMDRWLHLNVIYKKLMYCTQNDDSLYVKNIVEHHSSEPLQLCNPKSIYTKFNAIKTKAGGIGHVNLSTTQIMLNVKSMDNDEMNLSLSGLKSKLVICNRPEKIHSTISIEGLSLNLINQHSTLILLHPWSFDIYANLFWESWQNSEDDCLMQLNTDSDCFVLGVGPEHIKVLQKIMKEYEEILEEMTTESRYTVVQAEEDMSLVETSYSESSENTKTTQGGHQSQDQHYKDDLRAGAFQFVDASIAEEIPLPYQVLFWSGIQGTGSMSWRYPQPRLLTKVHIYPVPFQVNPEDSSNVTVYCQLEYYSEVHGAFLPYSQFTLSESKMLRLNMPTHIPDATASSVWRVLMSSTNFESDQTFKYKRLKAEDYTKENVEFGLLVSPRALAACMRIDSFFSATLVPRMKAVLKFSSIQFNVYNHLDLTKGFMMPQSLKDYQVNTINPIDQEVISLTLDSSKAYYCRWANDSQLVNVDSSIKCTVLDYGFLTTQTLMEPLVARLNFSQANMMSMSLVSKPIIIKFGPSLAHTLAITEQMWTNSFLQPQNMDAEGSQMELIVPELVIMTRYVICNDTNFTLRFGQSATDENIILPPNTCNYYAWRSHKKKQLLRVGIIEHDQMWSEVFGIEKCGRHFVKFDLNPDVIVLVNIELLSTTQKKITFCGQLTIYNMSTEVFDMRVYPVNFDKASIADLPSHTLLGRSKGPSLVVDSNEELFMRLRFQGLDTYWSGDIPLKENSKNHQPWLVKVPLQEKGHFLCIWCKVVTQDESNICRRLLIVLWPLYMIRSHLPMATKAQIDTPALDVHLQTIVEGRGITKQLYCPGTIDHSHQLTFQIEMGLPASNPYVPLSYSLIDQKQFFETDISNIDQITKLLDEQLVQKSQWPFIGEEFPQIDWIAMDQPQTNVTVRYQPTGPSSCSLLLELLPWCIMLNTSGLHLSVHTYNQEMSQLPHHGVLTPPKLENTFTIQVYMDNTWHISNPLQFSGNAKSNGNFYMPKITGLIPQEGAIKTAIQCNSKICNISIISEMKHDIRIVRIGSSHVAYNATDQPLKMVTFAMRLDAAITPKELPLETEIVLQPAAQMRKMGMPITEWYNLSFYDTDQSMTALNSTDYGFFICISAYEQTGISCPIRVDSNSIRKSTTVPCEGYSIPLLVTTHHYKGQTYVTLQYDINPQLLIINESYLKLVCAQATPESVSGEEEPTPVLECPELCVFHAVPGLSCTYYTMPYVNNNFPEIQNGNGTDYGLIFAVANDNDIFWCQPISVTSKTVMCIPLPMFGDIKITITPYCYTTTVVIQTVSEIEISAREIRSRLSCSGSDILLQSDNNKLVQKLVHSPKHNTRDDHAQGALTEDDYSSVVTTPTHSDSRLPVLVKNSPLPRLVSSVIENSRPTMRSYALPTIQESNTKLQHYISPEAEFSENSFDLSPNEAGMSMSTRGSSFFNSLTLGVFLKSLTIVLMTDVDDSGMDKTELASFTLDEFAVTISPCPEEVNVHISMSNMQIDNQLFNRGDYDFPVVMLGHKYEKSTENFSLTTRIYELIAKSRHSSLISLRLDFEVFDNVRINSIGIKDITLKTDSISLYIEDGYFSMLLNYFDKLSPANLIVQPVQIKNYPLKPSTTHVWVPEKILLTSKVLGRPLKINRLTIYPVDLLLSVHSSIRMYIALDHSPLHFGTFEKKNILTTHFKLGHSLAMHYLSGAIFGAGWVVGSLEILGSPSGLARSVGSGLRDFVQKPYEGMLQGPWGFLVGVAQGSTSLMKHITAGTVNSLSKMAASVARNLDRLTLDSEHFQRTEELRRIRPQGLSQGLLHGLTGLGISILGAVGGIAHHPLSADSATGMMAGVGLGLVGAIAKPISGAAELVALAGQGLLHGTGWHVLPQARSIPIVQQSFCFNNANLKYVWKVLPSLLGGLDLLCVTEGTCITQSGGYEAVALVLTLQALVIFDLEEDACQREIALSELQGSPDIGDPTLICFRITHPETPIATTSKMDIPTMDPSCRARVAQYIHYANTLNAPLHNVSDTQSDTSISSQLQTPTESDESFGKHSKVIFYINPQTRNHFLNMFTLAKKQKEGLGFPVF